MCTPCKPLSCIMCGEKAVISSFQLPCSLRDRLFSLGMIPGTEICCLHKRKGGLAAYSVRGSVIALRLSDAMFIFVKNII
ncbi:MAG: ferrous iron transport protein A [Oscillospiraceae bacterium]|nr:ferrous iron transport protein A [Oscillospiraceae bacterium]